MRYEKEISAIIDRAYHEGYTDGYKDGKAQKATEQAPLYKTPQAIRDEIVAEAKADIEGLKTYSWQNDKYLYQVGNGLIKNCDAEFIVNKEKRTVVVLLKGIQTKTIRAKGIAKCDPQDCFNVHIGKAIALRRALGKDVPERYLLAPKPTEFRVGDKVSRPVWENNKTVMDELVPDITGRYIRLKTVQNPTVGDLYIADDSRE